MSDEILLVPSRELVLQEFKKIKDGGTSELLNVCVEYASLNPEKCIAISSNLSKELYDLGIVNPHRISTFFSIEREFGDGEIRSNIAESQKKLASELDLDYKNIAYVSDDKEALDLVKTNYQISVITTKDAIVKVKSFLK